MKIHRMRERQLAALKGGAATSFRHGVYQDRQTKLHGCLIDKASWHFRGAPRSLAGFGAL